MTSDQYERIIVNQSILAGKPIVRGTRISVAQVLGHLAAGWTLNQLLENYPTLQEPDVRACLAYARDMVAEEVVVPSAA